MSTNRHAERASQILSHQIGSLTLQLANEQARGDCLAMDLAEAQGALQAAQKELADLKVKGPAKGA